MERICRSTNTPQTKFNEQQTTSNEKRNVQALRILTNPNNPTNPDTNPKRNANEQPADDQTLGNEQLTTINQQRK